jgi:hypothetical protein
MNSSTNIFDAGPTPIEIRSFASMNQIALAVAVIAYYK